MLQYAWSAGTWGYARRRTSANKREKITFAHQDVCLRLFGRIADRSRGEVTDHINRNRLDNRRENLRFVSRAQNNENSDAIDNARGFYLEGKKYRAYVRVAGKYHNLGAYKTQAEARSAYLAGIREMLPERFASVTKKHGAGIP